MTDELIGQRILIVGASGNGTGAETARAGAAAGAEVTRAANNWSQAHLADLLGVTRQTVNAPNKGRYDRSLPLAFVSLESSRPLSKTSSTRVMS